MAGNNHINIVPSHNLDKHKWDNCIAKSTNGLVYATSIYLDTMATKWDGMIINDYEYVMPLPRRRKWLINYVYIPAFIQQLGIFSNKLIDDNTISLFIQNIPKKYRYLAMHFNYANRINIPGGVAKKNYLLNLSPGYDVLRGDYSRSANRNISKAQKAGITITECIKPGEIIKMHRERFADHIGADKNDYENFTRLSTNLLQQGHCYTFGALNHQGQLCAGSIYWLYRNRLTFILNGNSKESLENGATHLLKDFVIKKFAAPGLILDFEGSDTPSFARFYEQFGAKEIEYYTAININRLPFPLRLLKR